MSDTTHVDIPMDPPPQDPALEQQQTEQPDTGSEELLAGKFKSQDDLVKAYKELESKLGSQSQAESQEDDGEGPAFQIDQKAPEAKGEPEFDAAKYEEEFMANGSLSDDSRKELTKMGLPESWIDTHEAGLQALRNERASNIRSWMGGNDQANQIMSWAQNNLSEGEKVAIEAAANGSDVGAAEAAIRGLVARYEVSPMGASPIEGSTGGSTVAAFRSNAEMTAAINDPRYDTDEAYRKDVQARIAARG